MFELKPIHASAVPAALQKAERYRLLNEPHEAESICRDVLAIDPGNARAQFILVLALTDQFVGHFGVTMDDARQVAAMVEDEYERTYLCGLIFERWAKAQRHRGLPAQATLGWLREALLCFERAETLAAQDNDEAVLRWNACVRLLSADTRARQSELPAGLEEHGIDIPLD